MSQQPKKQANKIQLGYQIKVHEPDSIQGALCALRPSQPARYPNQLRNRKNPLLISAQRKVD